MRHLRSLPDTAHTVSRPLPYDKSWALLIGINDYRDRRHPRLDNARNDADAMANLLRNDYKFDPVITLFDSDATRSVLFEWLYDRLPNEVGPNDRLVLFFAGHGTSRLRTSGQSIGYLIPQDAAAAKYSEYIDMDELRKACTLIPAKHIFVILDCCFSGIAAVTARTSLPPSSSSYVTDSFLQRVTEKSAWQVLTAGGDDELAADSGSRPGHSAFTGALLSGLEGGADQNNDGIITAWDLASFVQQEVSHESTVRGGKGQTPFFNYLIGSENGNFVFLRPDLRIPIMPRLNPVPSQPTQVSHIPKGVWGTFVGVIFLVLITLAWDNYQRAPQAEQLDSTTAGDMILGDVTPPSTASIEPTDIPTLIPSTDTPQPAACVPSLISPEEGAVLDNGRTDLSNENVWNFDWSDCPGATHYHLYVIHPNARNPNIDTVLNNSSFQDRSTGYVLDKNRFEWTWQVRAKIADQWGEWSEVRTFDVEPVNSDP